MTALEQMKLLCALVKRICETKKRIAPDTRIEDTALDSLNFIALMVECENVFGIEFDDEALNIRDYATVGDIGKTIAQRQKTATVRMDKKCLTK
jgi:acyl carrier protein